MFFWRRIKTGVFSNKNYSYGWAWTYILVRKILVHINIIKEKELIKLFKGGLLNVQTPWICSKSRPKTMDETNVLELHFLEKKKTKKQNQQQTKNKTKSSRRRSVILGTCRRRKCASVVLDIDVLWACLKERASGSTKIELYNKIKVGEVLCNVQPEVFEPSCVVLVQQVSELLGRLELYNCVLLCLFEKGA